MKVFDVNVEKWEWQKKLVVCKYTIDFYINSQDINILAPSEKKLHLLLL